jgi:hypothetical protein
MVRGSRRRSPALLIACVALFAVLGGTVYAAAKIDGHTIKPKSLPGNRLALRSVASNRLKPGSIGAAQLTPGSVTGIQIDASTLGQVPSAVHADTADSARDAQSARYAVEAESAKRVNGHSAGCADGTRFFAGACWQIVSSQAALTAPTAARSCAALGGELPDALTLAAFAKESGVNLDEGGEWSGDIPTISGAGVFGVITVAPSGTIDYAPSESVKKYRCVIPLVT